MVIRFQYDAGTIAGDALYLYLGQGGSTRLVMTLPSNGVSGLRDAGLIVPRSAIDTTGYSNGKGSLLVKFNYKKGATAGLDVATITNLTFNVPGAPYLVRSMDKTISSNSITTNCAMDLPGSVIGASYKYCDFGASTAIPDQAVGAQTFRFDHTLTGLVAGQNVCYTAGQLKDQWGNLSSAGSYQYATAPTLRAYVSVPSPQLYNMIWNKPSTNWKVRIRHSTDMNWIVLNLDAPPPAGIQFNRRESGTAPNTYWSLNLVLDPAYHWVLGIYNAAGTGAIEVDPWAQTTQVTSVASANTLSKTTGTSITSLKANPLFAQASSIVDAAQKEQLWHQDGTPYNNRERNAVAAETVLSKESGNVDELVPLVLFFDDLKAFLGPNYNQWILAKPKATRN